MSVIEQVPNKPNETQAIMEIGIISCGESETDEITEQPLAKKSRLEKNEKYGDMIRIRDSVIFSSNHERRCSSSSGSGKLIPRRQSNGRSKSSHGQM
ncbi:hypothetical protein BpHYR1_004640 [Brachionus plicatilis]|uniref:Uncharacterized protein n=1 Tax=Brachionus plicatilis TaxID=10195 RepID=A0A3M7S7T9_BRAPC|nr:hypothetical protein BpHYR1_004640 [Brachionus plicatilis]